jgi:hypothetical protein
MAGEGSLNMGASSIPSADAVRVKGLAVRKSRFSFHWTFDEGDVDLYFEDEAKRKSGLSALNAAMRLINEGASDTVVMDAMPPMTFEFDFRNSASDADDIDDVVVEAQDLFVDVEPINVPLTSDNAKVLLEGDPEDRLSISVEVVFSLQVNPDSDPVDVQDFIDRHSVSSAGYVGGSWIGGYKSDSGGFLKCLNLT